MTTQYKGQLRALNLYNKGHSVPHNIITGKNTNENHPKILTLS